MLQNIPTGSNRIEILELHLKQYKNPFSDVIFHKTHTALALQDSHDMPKGN
jgi:hypothetical protein